MKTLIILFGSLIIFANSNAQIAKKTIVEHFTNSNCSICASTNPTFYSALSTYPNVLHISFHPSSPYASCVFSQANKQENDARTNYYGIFGGTPKFIVNGTLGSVGNMATILSNVSNETTNFSINTTQEFLTTDSIEVTVVIKKVAADTLSSASLFVGAYQDTINQTTGNGESIHRDVFRKGLSLMNGDLIQLPMAVNDSIVKKYGYKVSSTWIASKMNTISILQQTGSKAVIQSSKSINSGNPEPSSIKYFSKLDVKFYPNPATSVLYLNDWDNFSKLSIYTFDGRSVSSEFIKSSKINIQHLSSGVYIFRLNGQDGVRFEKVVIKN